METMTQKEKELLLKDLCARLPYGVKVRCDFGLDGEITEISRTKNNLYYCKYLDCKEGYCYIESLKPYLFPLSSMTEEQEKEYNRWKHEVPVCHYEYGDVVEEIELYDSPSSFEYLIENHFDVYDLIPKGLAKDATGLNIY